VIKKPKEIAATKLAYRRPAEPPMLEGTVLIVETIAKRPVYMISHELEPMELAAIGEITVQWAHLEHMLLVRTLQLAKRAGETEPEAARSTRFSERLKAWRRLYLRLENDQARLDRLEKTYERIASAEVNRHKITHGLWAFNRAYPFALTASSFRAPYAFEQHFDFAKLKRLAHTIAEVNFHLQFPDGPQSLEPSQAFVSRSFLQDTSVKERPPIPSLPHSQPDVPRKARRPARKKK
jgi:hypothetical protein